MSSIASLGYIGIQSKQLEDWDRFSTDLLGMQRVDRAKGLSAFRMDDRKQRLIVDARDNSGPGFIGWEVAHRHELDALAARLQDHHIAFRQGSRSLAEERFVADLIVLEDPAGHRLEFFWKPEIASDPFVASRPINGFKTGPLGMGHVVLHVSHMEPMLVFYRDILGFSVTDYAQTPYRLYFLHVNNRHHSFAMVETGRNGLHHFMLELYGLDDVGQGYDLAMENDQVAFTLGRHSNDWMTSFYAQTPSGFFVEYGWGAREIDPGNWEAEETFDGPSYWGHDRLHLPPEARRRQREMTLDAARRGLQAGNPVNCPWLDSVTTR
ncbi:MAG: VOC family protein [Rhizobiaceae bacterium]|nr:VOC family protein [Rhizobiaceae bacterium]